MSKYSMETSFLGQRIPKEIKGMIKELKNTKKESYVKAIDQVLNFIQSRQSPNFEAELDSTKSRLLFGGFYFIIKQALRNLLLSPAAFKRDLTYVNFNDEVLQVLTDKLYQSNSSLEHVSKSESSDWKDQDYLAVDWRVDVAISNNHLSKLLKPEVMLKIQTSSGRDITTSLSVEQFNLIRLTTAHILHDMCQLKERRFMQ